MRKATSALKRIAQMLQRTHDEKNLRELLEDLLTPAELLDLNERVLIVQALLDGKTQREVAKQLGVSIATVSRGSQVIQYGNGALTKLVAE